MCGGGCLLDRHACAGINLTRVICVSVRLYIHIYIYISGRPIINFGGGGGRRGGSMILYDNEAWLIDKGYDRIGIRISRSFTLFSILGGVECYCFDIIDLIDRFYFCV